MNKKEFYRGLSLVIEVAWGTMLFLTIAAIALGAHMVLAAMISFTGVAGFAVALLTAVKYGILLLDLVCYVALMIRAAKRFLKGD